MEPNKLSILKLYIFLFQSVHLTSSLAINNQVTTVLAIPSTVGFLTTAINSPPASTSFKLLSTATAASSVSFSASPTSFQPLTTSFAQLSPATTAFASRISPSSFTVPTTRFGTSTSNGLSTTSFGLPSTTSFGLSLTNPSTVLRALTTSPFSAVPPFVPPSPTMFGTTPSPAVSATRFGSPNDLVPQMSTFLLPASAATTVAPQSPPPSTKFTSAPAVIPLPQEKPSQVMF